MRPYRKRIPKLLKVGLIKIEIAILQSLLTISDRKKRNIGALKLFDDVELLADAVKGSKKGKRKTTTESESTEETTSANPATYDVVSTTPTPYMTGSTVGMKSLSPEYLDQMIDMMNKLNDNFGKLSSLAVITNV